MDGFVFADAGSIALRRFYFDTFRFTAGFGARLELINRVPVILGMGFPINRQEGQKYANSSSLWEDNFNPMNNKEINT